MARFAIASLVAATLLPHAAVATTSAPAAPAGMSVKEAQADRIWALRSGLNVAALQCQFSPFLATVPTYNALLRQHSDEMAAAFKTMNAYFARTKGAKGGQRAFDSYATRANQSWATFDSQVSFCNTAALIGRRGLAVPKGQFGAFAEAELPALRASADSKPEPMLAPRYEWAVVPTLTDPCKGRSRCR